MCGSHTLLVLGLVRPLSPLIPGAAAVAAARLACPSPRLLRPWAALLVAEEASAWLCAFTSDHTLGESLVQLFAGGTEDIELFCRKELSDAFSLRSTPTPTLLPCVAAHGVLPSVAAGSLLAGSLATFPSSLDVMCASARCVQIQLQPDALDATEVARDLAAAGVIGLLVRGAARYGDKGVNAIAPAIALLARNGAHAAVLPPQCSEGQLTLPLLLAGLRCIGTQTRILCAGNATLCT